MRLNTYFTLLAKNSEVRTPTDSPDDVGRRQKFYNDPEVARYLVKHGVPKTKRALNDLLAVGIGHISDSMITPELVQCLGL